MSIFEGHKVTASELLNVIPEDLMTRLAQTSSVDHYTKILHGKKMFYLLLYGILECDRPSQRSLQEVFNDRFFKTLFNLDQTEKIRRSSISERLCKIDPDYFRQIYEHVYAQFSEYYRPPEQQRYNLIRVDSTTIADTTGRLMAGMSRGEKNSKIVKYSVAFDGTSACDFKVFTQQKYLCEDNALPEVVRSHVKRQADHRNLYVLDRGLQSARSMQDFSHEKIAFVARIKEKRKHVELQSLLGADTDLGELTLIADRKVYFYTNRAVKNKQDKTSNTYKLVEEPFRLIIAQKKDGSDSQYWLATNDFESSPRDICAYYRRRWDIEVFFRFIKQELHAGHLISLNANGIQVVLYMTLIVAMLLLIYKRANNIGYKTAKRRFYMEVRNLTVALIVELCGGDPDLFFNVKKE